MRRITAFFNLPLAEKVLLGEALLLVAVFRLALWFVPFRFLRKLLIEFLPVKDERTKVDWRQIAKIVRAVRTAARFVPAATCLTQALAAMVLIKSNGQYSELKIGVAKGENEPFQAHAWLETNGCIIIGKLPSHHQYKALESFLY